MTSLDYDPAPIDWDKANRERRRASLLGFIDARMEHLKYDMEILVKRIDMLLSEIRPGDPLLDENEVKAVRDAKIALREADSALLAIRCAQEAYRRRMTDAMLEAAE